MNSFLELKSKWRYYKLLIYGITLILIILSSDCTEIASSSLDNSQFVPELSRQEFISEPQFPGSEEEKLIAYEEYLNQLSDEDRKTIEQYEDYIKKITNPDQFSLKAYDYFINHWQPEEINFQVPSEELPNFQESFQSIFFEEWVSKPSYSLSPNENQDIATITFEDEKKIVTIKKIIEEENELTETTILSQDTEIYERTIHSGNQIITEKTTFTGQPRIRLIEPDLSDLDNIHIPIHPHEKYDAIQ